MQTVLRFRTGGENPATPWGLALTGFSGNAKLSGPDGKEN